MTCTCPQAQARRQDLMVRYGTDGYYLLEQVHGPGAPAWLRELPAVQALRRIWIQQFCREVTDGRQEVRRREKLPGGDGLPPGRDQLISPYDLDARYGIKRETGWGGYKVHFTETCDAPGTQAGASPDTGPAPAAGPERGDRPNLVTGVATTEATVPDSAMLTPVHQQLEERQLLPGEHLAGSGYPSAELIIRAARVFGITLVSPLRLDNSAQARAGAGYDKAAFAFDFDARQATCPQGIASSTWTRAGSARRRRSWCPGRRPRACPARHASCAPAAGAARSPSAPASCTKRSPAPAPSRPQRSGRHAITPAPASRAPCARPPTSPGSAGHATSDCPRPSSSTTSAAAINMIRMDAYWTGHPLDRTRSSHLARLDFTLTA